MKALEKQMLVTLANFDALLRNSEAMTQGMKEVIELNLKIQDIVTSTPEDKPIGFMAKI